MDTNTEYCLRWHLDRYSFEKLSRCCGNICLRGMRFCRGVTLCMCSFCMCFLTIWFLTNEGSYIGFYFKKTWNLYICFSLSVWRLCIKVNSCKQCEWLAYCILLKLFLLIHFQMFTNLLIDLLSYFWYTMVLITIFVRTKSNLQLKQ